MQDGIESSQDSYAQHVSIRVQKKERDYASIIKLIDLMLTN